MTSFRRSSIRQSRALTVRCAPALVFSPLVLLTALLGGCGDEGNNGDGASGSGSGGAASGGAASGGSSPQGGSAPSGSGGSTPGSGGSSAGGSAGLGGAGAQAGGGAGGVAGSSAGSGGIAAAAGAAGAAGGAQAGTAGTSGSGGGGGAGGSAGSAGSGGSAGAAPYNPCPPQGQPCKVLPLGDSITLGSSATHKGSYRVELFRLAHSAGKSLTFVGSEAAGPTMVNNVSFPRNHEGHSGYTIDKSSREGILPIVQGGLINTYKPHIVTLMIGTNDVNIDYQLSSAGDRLATLMDRILADDPKLLLVVAQIVPTRLANVNRRVETFNARIPALVEARAQAGKHVVMVDMYKAFTADANYSSSLLTDDLHPSDAGYVRMAATWYPVLRDLLR